MLTWKLRITVLWIFLAICQTAGMALLLFEPGVIRGLMDGQLYGANTHSAAVQINTALFWLGPMAMAFLTLALKDAASRWTNAVVGTVTAVSAISILLGQPSWTSAGVNFVMTVATLVTLLIVWHAWKWPRGAEVTPTREGQEPTRRSLELTRH
jgi:CBS-domain-containing membrane protein